MTPSQIDALQIVINNAVIMDALKKVFTDELEHALPRVDSENNEVIGQKYRAYEKSKEIINDAFFTLNGYAKTSSGTINDERHI